MMDWAALSVLDPVQGLESMAQSHWNPEKMNLSEVETVAREYDVDLGLLAALDWTHSANCDQQNHHLGPPNL